MDYYLDQSDFDIICKRCGGNRVLRVGIAFEVPENGGLQKVLTFALECRLCYQTSIFGETNICEVQ